MSEKQERHWALAERLGLALYRAQAGLNTAECFRADAAASIIQSLEAEVAKLRKRLDWMCSECRTVFQSEDLHKGPRCVLCPGCGKASMHTLDELRCIEAEAEVIKLKAEVHEVSRERHDAEEEAQVWRRVAEKLKAELLAVAHETGIVHQADGHSDQPGPASEMVQLIRDLKEEKDGWENHYNSCARAVKRACGVHPGGHGWHDAIKALRELNAERESRWTQLRITSNSGKTLFSCKCCGRISPTPDKTCNTQHDGWGAARQVDCSAWMPDVIPLAKHRQQAGEGGDET